jgi:hypothetical protein
MNARIRERAPEGVVIELDGPPTQYFEIPLDYYATPNGELEPEGHPDAVRLAMRVNYFQFLVADTARVRTIIARVTERLKDLGGGYIWWGKRPTLTEDKRMRLRLGTTPQLPDLWWARLSADVGNIDG